MPTGNSMYDYTYPMSDTQIKAEDAGNPKTPALNLPLSLAFFPIRAADGEPNVIKYCIGADALTTYGEETFNRFGPYYRNEQTYFEECVAPNGGCLLVRLCDPKAKKASTVVEINVVEGVQVPQYKRDEFGGIVLDANGKPTPLMTEGNVPVTELGIKYRFSARPLAEGEVLGAIKKKTVTVGEETVVTYPLVDGLYKSPGAVGDRNGFKFYCTRSSQPGKVIGNEELTDENGGALLYTFAPMRIPSGSNISVSVEDKYGYVSNNVFVKPGAVDTATQRRMSFQDIIERCYHNPAQNKQYLPFEINVYSDNFKLVGDLVKSVETNDPTIIDGWGVDILTFLNSAGYMYHHVMQDDVASTAELNAFYVNHFSGGDDGDLSDSMFEDLYRQLLDYTLIPEIQDYFKYPITHIYDVGYTMPTKLKLAAFIGKHPRLKTCMAAQDATKELYTMDQAVSSANAIKTRAVLTPESVYYGTEALRCEIFSQAGYLKDTTIKNVIPSTFWMCLRRSQLHSGQTVKDTVAGDPNNIIDIYRKDNFTPYSADQKQLLWDGASNYYQYATMLTKFFPAVVTVYRKKSSMLSDTTYTDCCVYLMYIVDRLWTKYASKTIPIAKMSEEIKEAIERSANFAFGGRFTVTANVFVTAEDIEAGDQCHIETVMVGYSPMRKWFNTLISRRENYVAVATY